VQAKDHADTMKGELDDYLRTQKERQAHVESMDQELRDTRLRMQDALEKAQSAREQCELGDKERFALFDKISTLETQILNLRDANQFLTNRSKTLQERYNNGDLVSGLLMS
jgi:chromosome segregation ATPase